MSRNIITCPSSCTFLGRFCINNDPIAGYLIHKNTHRLTVTQQKEEYVLLYFPEVAANSVHLPVFISN